MMRRFVCYRRDLPPEYQAKGVANAPDEVQFEGVVFSDGTVCVRWMTEFRSCSMWASIDDLIRVHGHPEYGTEIVWLDETVRCEECGWLDGRHSGGCPTQVSIS